MLPRRPVNTETFPKRPRAIKAWGCLCLLLMVSSIAVAAETELAWPFDRSPELSSSFGEYRSGRPHMGIDLSTGGAIGLPVHAAADGSVVQVRCSPWGYGKAIYVAFNNGHTGVYGHLSDFREDLRGRIRAEQHAKKSYAINLIFKPGEVSVKKGEVVAKSGDTGIGPAHLHFELRDGQNRPVNPRLLGISWNDTAPPIFRGILIAPRNPESRVNGDVLPAVLPVEHKAGTWTCAPVRVRGEFGIAVDLIDPTPSGNQLGPHRVRLLDKEGGVLWEIENDQIAYDEPGESLEYHPHYLGKNHYQLLWRWPGNKTSPYAANKTDGWMTAKEGPALLRIETEDFMGNAATLEIPLKSEDKEPVPAKTPTTTDKVDGKITLDALGEFLIVSAKFPAAETRAPELLIDGTPAPDAVVFAAKDHLWRMAWKPAAMGARHELRVRHPRIQDTPLFVDTVDHGKAATIRCDDGIQLSLPAGAACGPLFLWMDQPSSLPDAHTKTHGPAWQILPASAPLDKDATITLPLTEDTGKPARTAIARLQGDSWSWLKSSRHGKTLSAATSHLGTFRVLEDDQPPRVKDFMPDAETPVHDKRPAIRAAVSDVGSGIAAWSLECDGKWLLSAYDPDAETIAWERDEDLTPGAHELALTLTDNAGNSTIAKHPVVVPK